MFKRANESRLIVNVTLALPRQWAPVTGYADVENELRDRNIAQPRPRDVFNAVVAIRRRKLPDPAEVGNAGSFFKNPVISRLQRAALIERHPSLVSYDIGGGRYKLAAGWLIRRLRAQRDGAGPSCRLRKTSAGACQPRWRYRYEDPCFGARGAGRCASEVQHRAGTRASDHLTRQALRGGAARLPLGHPRKGSRMNKEIVSTSDAPSAIGPYSQAVKTGLVVFTSGQIRTRSRVR